MNKKYRKVIFKKEKIKFDAELTVGNKSTIMPNL